MLKDLKCGILTSVVLCSAVWALFAPPRAADQVLPTQARERKNQALANKSTAAAFYDLGQKHRKEAVEYMTSNKAAIAGLWAKGKITLKEKDDYEGLITFAEQWIEEADDDVLLGNAAWNSGNDWVWGGDSYYDWPW